nr:hypothetical protein [Tanacetum cinerariifolium]
HDYMAAYTERMERFDNAIFEQLGEINNRMAEMFRLLKELTTTKAPKKVLIREEAKYPVTKNVNSISFSREKEEKNDEDNITTDIKKDENRPFILGTPFLTTAKVMIKFHKGTITLRSGKSKISFHRTLESLGKVKKDIKNDIEPIASTMTVN